MNFFKKSKQNNQPDVSAFLNVAYQQHNVKRLAHLDSLGFNFKKASVLEIGAGIGDHTYYYLIKGATVTSTDARPELVNFIRNRFGNDCFVLNAETELAKLENLPKYDVLHCYGLLYHIKSPQGFLNKVSSKTKLLLLETCVSHDFRENEPHIVDEDSNDLSQAVSGNGCRPTRRWIFEVLKRNFKYVYMPLTQPDHNEFPKGWSKPMEDRTKLIRAVFIASEDEIINSRLVNEIPKHYNGL